MFVRCVVAREGARGKCVCDEWGCCNPEVALELALLLKEVFTLEVGDVGECAAEPGRESSAEVIGVEERRTRFRLLFEKDDGACDELLDTRWGPVSLIRMRSQ